MIPPEVIDAYGWQDTITPISGGLINATYVVGDRRAVLQQLHPIFRGDVNVDIDAVTAHLAAKGLATPRVIRTKSGDAFVTHEGRVWRALTWVDGTTVHKVPDPSWAESAGELVGRFHVALSDFTHEYAFVRAGVHDTALHLERLRACEGEEAWMQLAREILAAAAALPPMPVLPRRHIHGDLKISNVMFVAARASCLVDLDTVGLGTMAFEIGDAMRSWCNPHAEDAGAVTFDVPIFEAAIRGFLHTAGSVVTLEERRSIVVGLETVCIELAARFCVDVFRDEYFGWDPARFPTRRAHNLVRARGQLGLGQAVRAVREHLLGFVERDS